MRIRGAKPPGISSVFLPIGNFVNFLTGGPGVNSTWVFGQTGYVSGAEMWRSVDGGAFAFRATLSMPTITNGSFGETVTTGHTYQYQMRVLGPDGFTVIQTVTAPTIVSA